MAVLLGSHDQILLELFFVGLDVRIRILNENPRLIEILDSAPAAKDGVLIGILGLLIVNVKEPNRFGVQFFSNPTDAIRVHSQVRNCLLGRLGMLGLGDLRLDLFDLFALGASQLNLAPLFSLISHLGQYG